MKKQQLVDKIIAQLKDQVALFVGAARTAFAEATHEESKADDQYDTRGLEASYLAAGQARQVAGTADALQQFGAMVVCRFGPKDPIDVSALVTLETKGERSQYFVGPAGGGTEVEDNGARVLVITPQSPLGQQLVGRQLGDRLKIKIAGRQNDYLIAAVS